MLNFDFEPLVGVEESDDERFDKISVQHVDDDENQNADQSSKCQTQAFLYEEPELGIGNARMLLLFDDEVDDTVEQRARGLKQSDMSSINWSSAAEQDFFSNNLTEPKKNGNVLKPNTVLNKVGFDNSHQMEPLNTSERTFSRQIQISQEMDKRAQTPQHSTRTTDSTTMQDNCIQNSEQQVKIFRRSSGKDKQQMVTNNSQLGASARYSRYNRQINGPSQLQLHPQSSTEIIQEEELPYEESVQQKSANAGNDPQRNQYRHNNYQSQQNHLMFNNEQIQFYDNEQEHLRGDNQNSKSMRQQHQPQMQPQPSPQMRHRRVLNNNGRNMMMIQKSGTNQLVNDSHQQQFYATTQKVNVKQRRMANLNRGNTNRSIKDNLKLMDINTTAEDNIANIICNSAGKRLRNQSSSFPNTATHASQWQNSAAGNSIHMSGSRKFLKQPMNPKTPNKQSQNSPVKHQMGLQDIVGPLNASQNLNNLSIPAVARVPKQGGNKRQMVRVGSPEALRAVKQQVQRQSFTAPKEQQQQHRVLKLRKVSTAQRYQPQSEQQNRGKLSSSYGGRSKTFKMPMSDSLDYHNKVTEQFAKALQSMKPNDRRQMISNAVNMANMQALNQYIE